MIPYLNLKKIDIESMIYNPLELIKQKALTPGNHLSFSITEQIHNEVLSIPMNSSLTNDGIDQIIQTLNQY